MEKNIVHIKEKEILTDTLIIAEMLDVPHTNLIRTVQAIVDRQNNNPQARALKFPQKFIEGVFQNKMNRSYKMYELNEQAYMKLAMQLRGYEKAEIVQDAIIEAFSMMKGAVLNQSNQSWLSAREDGKAIRSKEMDVVKNFVDYATKQGSKSAFRYYGNVTKMTNKALELLVQVKGGAPLRHLANIMELGFIQMLDNRAKQSIEYGMSEGLQYQEIYQIAKEEVNTLADSLNFNRKSLK